MGKRACCLFAMHLQEQAREYLSGAVTVLISYSLSRYLMLFSEELSKLPVVDSPTLLRTCNLFHEIAVVACVEKVKERLDER